MVQSNTPVSAFLTTIARRLRIEQLLLQEFESDSSPIAEYLPRLIIRLLLEVLPTQEKKRYQQIVKSGTEDELFEATMFFFEKYHTILLPRIQHQIEQLQSKIAENQ